MSEQASRRRRKTGRYRGVGAAADTGHLLPERVYHPQVQIAHASVPDPNVALRGKRQKAQVNIRVDLLEVEYHARRLDEGAYNCGRMYQYILESSRGSQSNGTPMFQLGGHQPFSSSDNAIVTRMAAAMKVDSLLSDTKPVIGRRGQMVLELVLLNGQSFAAVADSFVPLDEMSARKRRHSGSFYAEFFRNCLRDLAKHWSENGHPAIRI